MTTTDYLQSLGISLETALQFIVQHLDQPEVILNIAVANNVTSSMLAEILQSYAPGVSALDVENFFISVGLDPSPIKAPGDVVEVNSYIADSSWIIGTSSDGLMLVTPAGPLTDEQKFFIGGLIESKTVSRTFETDADMLITTTTAEGYRVNVAFGDSDYPDIIFAVSGSEMETLNDYMYPFMANARGIALAEVGLTQDEVLDLYSDYEANTISPDDLNTLATMHYRIQQEVDATVKPLYDAFIAGDMGIWL